MLRNLIILVSCLFFVSCSSSPEKINSSAQSLAANPTLEHGKQLFYSKCASCHMVNQELTGPALKGAEDRWPDKQKLYAFIRNSDSVIQTDKYARDLWLQYNQTNMTKHPDLKDENILAILEYVRSVSQ